MTTAPVSPAPVFRDPVHDGAADPVVVYNRDLGEWWMFYTNRRATTEGPGVGWVHGTDIGVASSRDDGATWVYRGIVEGLDVEWGRNTFWAPEIVWAEGEYHMYVSYIQGIPTQWAGHEREIEHWTSPDLLTWTRRSRLDLGSHKVIDACVFPLAASTGPVAPDGTRRARYRMWFKDEDAGSHTYAADSDDLYTWTPVGPVITGRPHEGPNVFRLGGHFWMIVDEWQGQRVYRSDDLESWEAQGLVLDSPGSRPDDATIGLHADVVVPGSVSVDVPAGADDPGAVAYVFYFTHPERHGELRDPVGYGERRTSVQVATLRVVDGRLTCDRDEPTTPRLGPRS
ncbi:hypothetical protein [Sanguibacter sp. 25GB23B1]|uniref:hypothetical protein n=1 Tax=unclassified Sanguibacter TaxID=2645534 RepID=UPI0032AF2CB9